MKCPKCAAKIKPSPGARCKCGYGFGLNPKESPYLSDLAMTRVIDKLSGFGRQYFTFNQLYAALYRALTRKKKRSRIIAIVVLGVIALAVTFIAVTWGSRPLGFLFLGLAVIGLFLMSRSAIQIPHGDLVRAINNYREANPIPNMVDGQRFKRHVSKTQMKHDLFDYAPERILVVPSDDMVDMLVLNRFHMDNKTAILSASKYPHHVFEACQRMLETHPDVPVEIIHDVSSEGMHLKSRLLADKSWNLEGRNVKDLGLFPDDVNRIKTPIWIPSGRPSSVLAAREAAGEAEKKPGVPGEAEKKLGEGMRMPLDFVGPRVMMGALAAAVIGGTLLMSEELLAEELRKTTKEGTADGGFG